MTTTTTRKATTTTRKATRTPAAPAASVPAPRKPFGKAIGTLAIDTYERGVGGFVSFEKKAADIAPYAWAKSALSLHAGLVEDVGAAYVKTARRALR